MPKSFVITEFETPAPQREVEVVGEGLPGFAVTQHNIYDVEPGIHTSHHYETILSLHFDEATANQEATTLQTQKGYREERGEWPEVTELKFTVDSTTVYLCVIRELKRKGDNNG